MAIFSADWQAALYTCTCVNTETGTSCMDGKHVLARHSDHLQHVSSFLTELGKDELLSRCKIEAPVVHYNYIKFISRIPVPHSTRYTTMVPLKLVLKQPAAEACIALKLATQHSPMPRVCASQHGGAHHLVAVCNAAAAFSLRASKVLVREPFGRARFFVPAGTQQHAINNRMNAMYFGRI